MRGERLDASQRLGVEEQLQRCQEASNLVAAFQLEAHHGAESFLLARGQLVLRMRLQSRISELRDLLVRRQELGDRAAVLLVLLDTQRHRLDAAQDQEALEGRENAACGLLDQQKALLVL